MNNSYVCPNPPPTPAPKHFKLEAVIVCDQYADFLAHTLPYNKHLFDKIVVVTSYEDRKTRKLCEYWHVECVAIDDLQTRKGEFHKGKGINAGLAKLDGDAWVVHMDADIYLPPQTRLILQNADLNPENIYGCDRFIIRGRKAWDAFLNEPKLQHEDKTYIHMGAFPLGTRIMHEFAGGYVPLGFFQLWHPRTSGVMEYPSEHTDAGRADTLFSQFWPRHKRGFIPEITAYHLESDDATNAANWSGRTTAPFVS